MSSQEDKQYPKKRTREQFEAQAEAQLPPEPPLINEQKKVKAESPESTVPPEPDPVQPEEAELPFGSVEEEVKEVESGAQSATNMKSTTGAWDMISVDFLEVPSLVKTPEFGSEQADKRTTRPERPEKLAIIQVSKSQQPRQASQDSSVFRAEATNNSEESLSRQGAPPSVPAPLTDQQLQLKLQVEGLPLNSTGSSDPNAGPLSPRTTSILDVSELLSNLQIEGSPDDSPNSNDLENSPSVRTPEFVMETVPLTHDPPMLPWESDVLQRNPQAFRASSRLDGRRVLTHQLLTSRDCDDGSMILTWTFFNLDLSHFQVQQADRPFIDGPVFMAGDGTCMQLRLAPAFKSSPWKDFGTKICLFVTAPKEQQELPGKDLELTFTDLNSNQTSSGILHLEPRQNEPELFSDSMEIRVLSTPPWKFKNAKRPDIGLSYCITIKPHLKEISRPARLHNHGTTCYLNAIVQTLFHLKPFRQAIFNLPTQQRPGSEAEEAVNALKQIFSKMQKMTEAVLDPIVLIKAMRIQIQNLRQEDADEFLTNLFDQIDEVIQSVQIENFIKEIFESITASLMKCHRVPFQQTQANDYNRNQKLTVADFSNIRASLFDELTLKDMGADSLIDASGFGKQRASVLHLFRKLPKVLQFQLKRFQNVGNQQEKLNEKVEFDAVLDLDALIEEAAEKSARDGVDPLTYDRPNGPANLYRLFAVVMHKGDNTQSGHYYVYLRQSLQNDTWMELNDSHPVKVIPQDMVLAHGAGGLQYQYEKKVANGLGSFVLEEKASRRTASAYLLFYVRESELDKFEAVDCKIEDSVLREISLEKVEANLISLHTLLDDFFQVQLFTLNTAIPCHNNEYGFGRRLEQCLPEDGVTLFVHKTATAGSFLKELQAKSSANLKDLSLFNVSDTSNKSVLLPGAVVNKLQPGDRLYSKNPCHFLFLAASDALEPLPEEDKQFLDQAASLFDETGLSLDASLARIQKNVQYLKTAKRTPLVDLREHGLSSYFKYLESHFFFCLPKDAGDDEEMEDATVKGLEPVEPKVYIIVKNCLDNFSFHSTREVSIQDTLSSFLEENTFIFIEACSALNIRLQPDLMGIKESKDPRGRVFYSFEPMILNYPLEDFLLPGTDFLFVSIIKNKPSAEAALEAYNDFLEQIPVHPRVIIISEGELLHSHLNQNPVPQQLVPTFTYADSYPEIIEKLRQCLTSMGWKNGQILPYDLAGNLFDGDVSDMPLTKLITEECELRFKLALFRPSGKEGEAERAIDIIFYNRIMINSANRSMTQQLSEDQPLSVLTGNMIDYLVQIKCLDSANKIAIPCRVHRSTDRIVEILGLERRLTDQIIGDPEHRFFDPMPDLLRIYILDPSFVLGPLMAIVRVIGDDNIIIGSELLFPVPPSMQCFELYELVLKQLRTLDATLSDMTKENLKIECILNEPIDIMDGIQFASLDTFKEDNSNKVHFQATLMLSKN